MSEKKRAKARREVRRRRKQRRKQYEQVVLLASVCICLLVVGAAVVIASPKRGDDRAVASRPQVAPEVEIAGPVITLEPEPEEESGSVFTTAARTVETATVATEAEPVQAAPIEEAPTEAPAEVSADASFLLQAADSRGDAYLPVFKRADTMERKIAITVDDCFQVSNLRAIITEAYKQKGRLTLCPIGENFAKSGMKETLQGAMKAGCEIENHTWSHSRVFRLPELQMAEEIWKQNAALNALLGINYKEHFFRLMGGDGSTDLRTHSYLKQLGYYGIAEWAVSGSDETLENIKKSLSPGIIYLFHTTNGDTEKLKQFIPYAVSQGYELVTLNELLGYPDNEITEYRETSLVMPQQYQEDYRTHKVGDYAWNVVRMQDKLRELGFLKMEGESTGYYGEQTAQAILDYQKSIGYNPTGIADSETQMKLIGT